MDTPLGDGVEEPKPGCMQRVIDCSIHTMWSVIKFILCSPFHLCFTVVWRCTSFYITGVVWPATVKAWRVLVHLCPFLGKSVVVLLVYAVTLVLSVLLYALLYWWMIPAVLHSAPLHLDYPEDRTQGPVGFFDFSQSHWRMNLADVKAIESKPEHSSSPGKHPGGSDIFPHSQDPPDSPLPAAMLRSYQHYDLYVILDMPESPYNYDVGPFMVRAELLTANGESIATSFRACILRYRSQAAHYLRTFFYTLPLVIGYLEERQVHEVQVYHDYVEDDGKRAGRVLVQLSERVQIYSSHVEFRASLSGLKYYMFSWFWCTLVTSVLGLSAVLMFYALMLYVFLKCYCKNKHEDEDGNADSSTCGSIGGEWDRDRRMDRANRLRDLRQRNTSRSSTVYDPLHGTDSLPRRAGGGCEDLEEEDISMPSRVSQLDFASAAAEVCAVPSPTGSMSAFVPIARDTGDDGFGVGDNGASTMAGSSAQVRRRKKKRNKKPPEETNRVD